MNWTPLHRPSRVLVPAAILLVSGCAGHVNTTRDEQGLKWVPGSYIAEGTYTVRRDTESEVITERRLYRAEITVTENDQQVMYTSEGPCLPIEKRGRFLPGPYRRIAFECGQSVLTLSPDRPFINVSVQISAYEQVRERAGCQTYSPDGETCIKPEVTVKLQRRNRSPRLHIRRVAHPGG